MFPRLLLVFAACALHAQTGEQVLLVANRRDPASLTVANYYRPRRSVPVKNVCYLETAPQEEISWDTYRNEIENPIAQCLEKAGLREKVLYIALTLGIPLKIDGGGSGFSAAHSSVDSELALLYGKLHGMAFQRAGSVPNPFFGKRSEPFRHPRFSIYLVARLAAFDVAETKAMIDRSLDAHNRGKFVLDLSLGDKDGDNWLRTAAILLPKARVVLDESKRVLYDQQDVIGYAAWGSNDPNRQRRNLGFHWLPGAVATEYVSTNARTLRRPPDDWTFRGWSDQHAMFGGSSQSLAADYIHQGATAATGNTYEPYLIACPRPDYLLPAYFAGRTLAESYYMSIAMLSWQGVLLGDPLCSLGRP
ncbi:MAG TPA: TIGR03790 family protein [Bryobacteraceae bacterium]|nr:TIGR03790 family protein [Bryobacteraceae bacterium]